MISFPDWRSFFRSKTNCVDLFIAITTSVIQIPAIHDSGAYGWLTIFQIMRVYRIIITFPTTRDLLVSFPLVSADLLEQSTEQCIRADEFNLLPVHDHLSCW